MADAWNGAWGSSWGVSWGSGSAPPAPTQRDGDGAPRRNSRRVLIYAARQAAEPDPTPPPPKAAGKRKPVKRRVTVAAIETAVEGWPIERAVEAAQITPQYLYVQPDAGQVTDAMMAQAVAHYLEQQNLAAEDDEHTAIALLMAAL